MSYSNKMTTIKELGEKYNLNFHMYQDTKYMSIIIEICNSINLSPSIYDLNDDNILFIIGIYYHHIKKNYVLMKKYYLMAIDRKQTVAMINYAMYFYSNSDYDQMIKYFAMAINNGYPNFFPQKISIYI